LLFGRESLFFVLNSAVDLRTWEIQPGMRRDADAAVEGKRDPDQQRAVQL